jgi:transcriptional regulator with XRE-family HTH domain
MTDRTGEDTGGLEPLAALGEAIRALRTQATLSQEELARAATLEASALAQIEAGQTEPTWADLRRLAYALETSLAQLLELAESLEQAGPGAAA